MAIITWSPWRRCQRWWRNYRVTTTFALRACVLVAIFCSLPPASLLATQDQSPPSATDQGAVTLLAVGDIADCNYTPTYYEETAALVATLEGDIAVAGDIAYPRGSEEDFANCFHPAWGELRDRLYPVPGNHEYVTKGAAGYFGYFGAQATPLEPDCRADCKGYYSYDLGGWHIVALNSNLAMTAGSPQEVWLRADLAANRTPCTLAYWHHPLFSSGLHGNDERSADVWAALYEAGVEVVINGHDHNYERFAPQKPDGTLDEERGIRQFVVGTGGARLRNFAIIQPNSEARNFEASGVLQLLLFPDRYTWAFLPIFGQTFADIGSATCLALEGDGEKQYYLPQIFTPD